MKYTLLRYNPKNCRYGIVRGNIPVDFDQMVSGELYVQNTGESLLCAIDEAGNAEFVFIGSTKDPLIHEMHESGMSYSDILRSFKI